ncbi:hypothetical protein [Methanolobus sp. WCC5]|uniref:hypothetical protein n=1 Tax=Methanolobus sp. WCC5 TaxID=3125785 RepID=UPI0032557FE8
MRAKTFSRRIPRGKYLQAHIPCNPIFFSFVFGGFDDAHIVPFEDIATFHLNVTAYDNK